MADALTPDLFVIDRLHAVNICLSAMGEPVINSLEDAAMDAGMAANVVDETSASVQTAGWYWNTETHTLSPNSNDGSITLPSNTIRVVVNRDQPNLVNRGLRLYNTDNGSFVFTNPITLRLTVLLNFDDMPLSAKQFIAIRAARIFQQRSLGNDALVKYDASDEQRAWAVLWQEEAETMKANVLLDNWSTQSVVSRWHFARGAYS